MAVKVILFGQLIEVVGRDTLYIDEVPDTETLLRKLHMQYPALSKRQFRVAVGKKLVTENTVISDDTNIALLPPFSGG